MKNITEVLVNFQDSSKSNLECLLINPYDEKQHINLRQELHHYQEHSTFIGFLKAELIEPFQFVDLCGIQEIDEATSVLFFEKIRGKVKLIIYDTNKHVAEDMFKYCNWLRMYIIN